MSAYGDVQKSRGMKETHIGPFMVRVYPNVIEVWDLANEQCFKFLPEQWAFVVQFIGIRGLHPEP